MKTAKRTLMSLVIGTFLVASAAVAAAQVTTPIGPQWWPSRWGPGDEAGASNLMTPEKVLEAVNRQIVCVGSDTWATEVQPNPDPNLRGPVHQELLTKNGIFNHENLDLSELVRDRVWEFAYVFVPVPLKGTTGSPGSPIAVR